MAPDTELAPADSQLSPAGQNWARALFPAVLLAAVFAVVWFGTDLSDFRAWIGEAGVGAVVAFVVISVALMSAVVPKTAVSITAGAMFGTTLGSGLMVVIAVAAAWLNYAIGRWWLSESIERRLRANSPATPADRQRWMLALAEVASGAGFGLHLLIRLSPVPTMVISYCMGAVGARRLPYLLAAAAAIGPQVLWVHGGATATAIHAADTSTLRWISGAVSIAMAVLVTIVVPREAMKRLEQRFPSEPCVKDGTE